MNAELPIYSLEEKILILSNPANYQARSGVGRNGLRLRNGRATKLLSNITEEEANIIFSNIDVQNAILSIKNAETLRIIFRRSPAFFQEIMFANEKVKNLLIIPDTKKKLDFASSSLNEDRNVFFEDEEVRILENLLHSIKSPSIFESLMNDKIFHRVIASCSVNQLRKSFFKDFDEVKLFHNIVTNDEISHNLSKKSKITLIFNRVSAHILLTEDYKSLVNISKFMKNKLKNQSDLPQIIVDEKTLCMMTSSMINDLFNAKNVDIDFIVACLKKRVKNILVENNYDFSKMFPDLGRTICSVSGVTYIYLLGTIDECKNDEVLKTKFIEFISPKLFPEEVPVQEFEAIKKLLFIKMVNNEISFDEYKTLFMYPQTVKTVFFLKFGKLSKRMDYIKGVPYPILVRLNVKHVNQIANAIHLINVDELSDIYSYAIKMYFVFGLERSLAILSGKYGGLNIRFYDNLNAISLDNCEMKQEGKKYLPILNEEFIKFMFASATDNHFMNMLANPFGILNKEWNYLFNNFEQVKEECHGQITSKKLEIILNQVYVTKGINRVSPDNYRLQENNIIEEICLGNKTFTSNKAIFEKVTEIYKQMKERIESSIPYVKGAAVNGYHYEMMKFNDPIIFTLGYKASCCFRTNDIGGEHLLHAALCRNGRILLIFDENDKFVAFVPLKRNGEVLIANSIECCTDSIKAFPAFMEAVSAITKISHSNETTPINLVCIGSPTKKIKSGKAFPKDVEIPTIFEKNDPRYCRTDEYHKNLAIIYEGPGLDLHDIKYGDPKASYKDPRPEIKSCNFRNSTPEEREKALLVINSIEYTKSLEENRRYFPIRSSGFDNVIYSEDWYVAIIYDEIHGAYLNYDERAISEYNIAIQELQKQVQKGDSVAPVKKLDI